MKLFTLFLCLIFVVPYLEAKEPHIVNFLGDGTFSFSLSSCWDMNGNFDSIGCEKEESDCELSGRLPSLNQTNLTVIHRIKMDKSSGSSSVKVHVEGMPRADSIYLSSSDSTKTKEKYPVGSLVTFFVSSGGYKENRSIVIGRQQRVDSTGVIENLEFGTANQVYKIKLPEFLPFGQRLFINILGERLIVENGQNEVNINLSSGEYDISIQRHNGGAVFAEKKIKLKVSPSNVGVSKVLDLSKISFSPVVNNESTKLSWQQEGYPQVNMPILKIGDGYESDPVGRQYIEKINELYIDDIKTNREIFFQVEKGVARVKEDKRNEFLTLLNRPYHTFELKGKCFAGRLRSHRFVYKIYSDTTEKKNELGVLTFVHGPQENEVKSEYKAGNSEKSEHYLPNFDYGSCRGETRAQAKHAVREYKDGWANLGKGPWGDHGWIEVEHTSLYQYRGANVAFGALTDVSFSDAGNGMVMVSGIEAGAYNSDGERITDDESVSFKTSLESLWRSNGDFAPRVECPGYGC